MTVAVQLIEDHEFKTGWPLVSVADMIGYSLVVILIWSHFPIHHTVIPFDNLACDSIM